MYQKIIDFWFTELKPQQWWQKDRDFDRMIQSRFGSFHQQAQAGELFTWRHTALGSLAEVIVLDQFSRNIYREHPQSFAWDSLALGLAQVAVAKGFDAELSQTERGFLYLPFMHSESPLIHREGLKLFESLGESNVFLKFEHQHKAIIDQFGRYPHRNQILGRESTAEEIEFLKQPHSSF